MGLRRLLLALACLGAVPVLGAGCASLTVDGEAQARASAIPLEQKRLEPLLEEAVRVAVGRAIPVRCWTRSEWPVVLEESQAPIGRARPAERARCGGHGWRRGDDQPLGAGVRATRGARRPARASPGRRIRSRPRPGAGDGRARGRPSGRRPRHRGRGGVLRRPTRVQGRAGARAERGGGQPAREPLLGRGVSAVGSSLPLAGMPRRRRARPRAVVEQLALELAPDEASSSSRSRARRADCAHRGTSRSLNPCVAAPGACFVLTSSPNQVRIDRPHAPCPAARSPSSHSLRLPGVGQRTRPGPAARTLQSRPWLLGTRSSPSRTTTSTSRRTRTTARWASGSPAGPSAEARLRRLRLARAVRACGGGRRRPRARPPRAVLGIEIPEGTIDRVMRRRLGERPSSRSTSISLPTISPSTPTPRSATTRCSARRALGDGPARRFAGIGFGGPLSEPCSLEGLAGRVEQELGRAPLVFASEGRAHRAGRRLLGRRGRLPGPGRRRGLPLLSAARASPPSPR